MLFSSQSKEKRKVSSRCSCVTLKKNSLDMESNYSLTNGQARVDDAELTCSDFLVFAVLSFSLVFFFTTSVNTSFQSYLVPLLKTSLRAKPSI